MSSIPFWHKKPPRKRWFRGAGFDIHFYWRLLPQPEQNLSPSLKALPHWLQKAMLSIEFVSVDALGAIGGCGANSTRGAGVSVNEAGAAGGCGANSGRGAGLASMA